MTKLLSVIAATFLAIAAIAPGAEAGFNVRINAPAGFSEVHKAGCGGAHRAFRRRVVRQSVRRPKRQVEVASRTVSKPAVIAKAEPKPEPVAAPAEKLAEIENSSIVSAADKVAEAKIEAQKPAQDVAEITADEAAQKVASAVKDVGCKTFFASVGMTLSVPCAK